MSDSEQSPPSNDDSTAGEMVTPVASESGGDKQRAELAAFLEKSYEKDGHSHDQVAGLLAKILSVEVRREVREIVSFSSGPLPSAEEMAKYADVDGAINPMILKMAEKEQDHRHKSQQYQLKSDRQALHFQALKTYLGQLLAFVIGMTTIVGGLHLLANDKSVYGIVSILAGLGALTYTYITGKQAGEGDQDADTGQESKHPA